MWTIENRANFLYKVGQVVYVTPANYVHDVHYLEFKLSSPQDSIELKNISVQCIAPLAQSRSFESIGTEVVVLRSYFLENCKEFYILMAHEDLQ